MCLYIDVCTGVCELAILYVISGYCAIEETTALSHCCVAFQLIPIYLEEKHFSWTASFDSALLFQSVLSKIGGPLKDRKVELLEEESVTQACGPRPFRFGYLFVAPL